MESKYSINVKYIHCNNPRENKALQQQLRKEGSKIQLFDSQLQIRPNRMVLGLIWSLEDTIYMETAAGYTECDYKIEEDEVFILDKGIWFSTSSLTRFEEIH